MKRTFTASLDNLYEMLDFIKTKALDYGFDAETVLQIELAAEEAIVNIVSYGYPEEKGTIEIEIVLSAREGFKIIIKDNGIPYNPLTDKRIDPHPIIEKPKPGGFGVFFILKIMDEVEYKRDKDNNILVLVKFLS